MNRNVFINVAVVVTLVDVLIHVRRSMIPDGNPFGSSLHQQFFLFSVVAAVLAVMLLWAPTWLPDRGWMVAAALAVWEVGAIGVWLIAYHAPNPAGMVPAEGYVSKTLELLVVLALLSTLRSARQSAGLGSSA